MKTEYSIREHLKKIIVETAFNKGGVVADTTRQQNWENWLALLDRTLQVWQQPNNLNRPRHLVRF